MNIDKINIFLARRDWRVTNIEIANTQYQALGVENIKNKINHPAFDNF